MWIESNNFLEYRYDSKVAFKDSQDHWTNGVCRLIGLSKEEAKKWVESVLSNSNTVFGRFFYDLSTNERIIVLKESSRQFFQISNTSNDLQKSLLGGNGPCGHLSNIVWEDGIRKENKFAVVGCTKCLHGWLIKTDEPKSQLKDTVVYEQNYFQGSETGVGYGNYLAQKSWRLEKSNRLVKQICGLCLYLGLQLHEKPNLLDIGSGYGFFRKAANDTGWSHDGVELSKYAVEICQKEFGFETVNTTLEQFFNITKKKYDIITLWDTLEHVATPEYNLKIVQELLSTDGICIIRTPNLMSLEREIFGRYYHSLKHEHLQYFSHQSLLIFLEKANLVPLFLTSESHLLAGFFDGNVHPFAVSLKGSDLFLIARKKCNKST